jgi:thiamine-monophosphate kinase
LYVTGRLGGSLEGRHLDFIPRVVEARWLTGNFRIHAMMDLSDGLAADLPRLAKASGCGYEISEEKVPRNRGCTVAQALGDGEDFELLFAVRPADAARLEAKWRAKFPRLPLTRIGALTRLRNADNPVRGGLTPRTGLSALRKSPASAQRGSAKKKHRGFDHFA